MQKRITKVSEMFEVILGALFIIVLMVMIMLVVYAFTDTKEQKLLEDEMYAEMQRREEAYKRYKEAKGKADEEKNEMRNGDTTDQFNNSINIMHKFKK